LGQNDNNISDEIEDDKEEDFFQDSLEQKLRTNIDDLQKVSIDKKRIRKIDESKKRAAIESVFDERTIRLLNKLLINGTLDSIKGVISAGKEANVYLAYDREEKEVAIKIYKIDSNTSKWMREYIIGDPRFKKIPNNISKIIYLWASKEFKNLKRAYNAGLSAPEPIFVKNNILIMEYIGFGPIPAPKLKDIKHFNDVTITFKEVLNFIKLLYQNAKLVHGDLSEFNILYHNQRPVIIDMSQAVSIQHPKAEVFLVRDIKNIYNFFLKYGLNNLDPESFYYDIINPS